MSDDLVKAVEQKRQELDALERELREKRLAESDAETDAQKRARLFGGECPIGKGNGGGLYLPTKGNATFGGAK